MNNWKLFWCCVDSHFKAPYESIKLTTQGFYPYSVNWTLNPLVGERTHLIWALRHCSGKSYLEEYEAGRNH